ncbi:MAG: hypothetical protein JW910_07165 [Anaerolineae bacterium]|nr:hypothetical protein [Anaerolineae bacterium]
MTDALLERLLQRAGTRCIVECPQCGERRLTPLDNGIINRIVCPKCGFDTDQFINITHLTINNDNTLQVGSVFANTIQAQLNAIQLPCRVCAQDVPGPIRLVADARLSAEHSSQVTAATLSAETWFFSAQHLPETLRPLCFALPDLYLGQGGNVSYQFDLRLENEQGTAIHNSTLRLMSHPKRPATSPAGYLHR